MTPSNTRLPRSPADKGFETQRKSDHPAASSQEGTTMPQDRQFDFTRRTAMLAATGVATLPLLARAPAALAQQLKSILPEDPVAMVSTLTDGVYINSNENPLGPCDAALKALGGLEKLSGRYGMAFADNLAQLFARQNGLSPDNVVIHPGSYGPLRSVALAYSSKERPIVYAEPTFDAGFLGRGGLPITRSVTVPLSGDYAIDVRQLLTAAPDAGVIYLCNPNNPTGLVTARADIEWVLANKPMGSVVLVDEAYIHYAPGAQSCLDLVAQGADVLVLRTFSKIYGLAGLRVGLIAGRKDLLDGLLNYGVNITPMPAVVAAAASLLDPLLVPQRRAYTAAVREDLYSWLKAHGRRFLPSQANFAMIEVGRPGGEVTAGLAKERVFISGPRKHMDNWVRVSFGTPAEMAAFKTAFAKTMA
jgi:histidinol-phosphate aminotransferase